MRLFHHASYRFIQMRRKAYVVSGVVLAIGIGAMGSLGSFILAVVGAMALLYGYRLIKGRS